ncbi:MAG: hypothetical protein J0I25_14820 [Sphingomonadales bacterium]|nr:hypothetical protein [Sphingomonadales bacterium]
MKRAFVTRGAVVVLGSLLLLAACGRTHPLRPAKGESLPPAPYGAETPPSGSRLIDPSAQARPKRGDDLLTNSQDRRSDQFDLPPR